LLKQRIILLLIEKIQLQALLSEKSTDSSEVEQKRLKLIQEQSELESQQEKLSQGMGLLRQQLNAIQGLLPSPLLKSWQQENANLSAIGQMSEQLQVALAQLSNLAEFDHRISVMQHTIVNSQNENILVKQLYLGAGLAWFVSLDGSYVGTGQVTEKGWVWQFDQSLDSNEIRKAIAIFEKQSEADFVELPFELASGSSH
jgi:hypothetical protein